jgi:Leucine-rich repeat (LRR) protein
VAESLKSNGSLQHLYLRGNEIGVEGAKAFVESLKINTSLEYLDLSGNKIETEGATAIAELLKANNLLQYLDVGCMSGFLFCFCSFLC